MPKKGRAIYMVFTDLRDDALHLEDEFNDWYSNECHPQVLALPGFLSGARYVATRGGPKYLSFFEIEDVSVLQSPGLVNRPKSERERRLAPTVIGENRFRWVGYQIYPDEIQDPERGMAKYIQIGRMSIPPELEDEWNRWYNEFAIPAYLTVPGVLHGRRFRATEGDTDYMSLHEFEHGNVTKGEDWLRQVYGSSPNAREMRAAMIKAPNVPAEYTRIDL